MSMHSYSGVAGEFSDALLWFVPFPQCVIGRCETGLWLLFKMSLRWLFINGMTQSESRVSERVFSAGFARTPLLSKTFVWPFGKTIKGFEIKIHLVDGTVLRLKCRPLRGTSNAWCHHAHVDVCFSLLTITPTTQPMSCCTHLWILRTCLWVIEQHKCHF